MNSEKLNKFFNDRYVKAVLFLLLLYLLLPNFFLSGSSLCEAAVVDVTTCLDQSWVLSINLALEKGLIFGRDYVFSYGVLGFLATRTTLGINPFVLLLFDLFILANFAFIFLYIFRKYYSGKIVCLCFLIVYTLSSGSLYIQDVVFLLLLFSVFWLNYSIKHNQVWALFIPASITVLLFYIKVNISFIGLGMFYGYLFYFFFSNNGKTSVKVLAALSVPSLIGLLSFPLRTDLTEYVRGGLSFIGGYNDAMNIESGSFLKFAFIAVVILIVFFGSFYLKNIKGNLILLLACGLFSYVLFKQSFVRSDMHVIAFFSIFPALCGLLLIFHQKAQAFQKYAVAGISLVCLGVGLWFGIYSNLRDKLNYFTEIASLSNFPQRHDNAFNRFSLPIEVREIIGSKNVDIIPWNIAYLYFNRLEYNPRPVIQSYSAFTPYLINLNGQKYDGDSAPDFVIFSNESIDGRYAFFDDQAAKISLIKNCSCLGLYQSGMNDFLLFQKNPRQKSVELSPPVENIIKFEENYVVPDTAKSYFIKFDVNYSLLGKGIRFAYKPFPTVMEFTFEDGSTRDFRVIVPALKNGVLINPFIENETDFFDFAEARANTSAKKIKSFRLKLVLPKALVRLISKETYDQDIRISVSEISIPNTR